MDTPADRILFMLRSRQKELVKEGQTARQQLKFTLERIKSLAQIGLDELEKDAERGYEYAGYKLSDIAQRAANEKERADARKAELDTLAPLFRELGG